MRTLVGILLWVFMGVLCWFPFYLAFQWTIDVLAVAHAGYSIDGFPWSKTQSPGERDTLLLSISATEISPSMRIFLNDFKNRLDYRDISDESFTRRLYDLYVFERRGKSRDLAWSILSRLPKYQNYTRSQFEDSIILSLKASVTIHQPALDERLNAEWRRHHKNDLAFLSKILNTIYILGFLLLMLQKTVGLKRAYAEVLSLTRFERPTSAHSTVRFMQIIITISALTLAIAHSFLPDFNVDAITLILVLAAILPWLAPLFKSMEFPGGWKFEFQDFQDVKNRAQRAGLLAPEQPPPAQYSFQQLVEEDPKLALAGLRIELEKRLKSIAESNNIDPGGKGYGSLLRLLSEKQILSFDERAVLADIVGLLNHAVHGGEVSVQTAHNAVEFGMRILKALERFS